MIWKTLLVSCNSLKEESDEEFRSLIDPKLLFLKIIIKWCRDVNWERKNKGWIQYSRIGQHSQPSIKKSKESARVQQMFRKSPSLGAQFVMNGDLEKHSVPPTDEALLEYWQKVFIQKSKSDCRPLERAIETYDEVDVPVTTDEII